MNILLVMMIRILRLLKRCYLERELFQVAVVHDAEAGLKRSKR